MFLYSFYAVELCKIGWKTSGLSWMLKSKSKSEFCLLGSKKTGQIMFSFFFLVTRRIVDNCIFLDSARTHWCLVRSYKEIRPAFRGSHKSRP